MKRLVLIGALWLLFLLNLCAAPSPPQFIGIVGAPTNGFWVTNISFIWTNTAVRTPTLDLAQVTVYGSNTISQATVLSWNQPTNTIALAGYKVYYGQVGGTTNIFKVSSNILSVAFYSTLATNVQWWAYGTAFDTNGAESLPSTQVLFTPSK